jgi:hypothetical protein
VPMLVTRAPRASLWPGGDARRSTTVTFAPSTRHSC